MATTSSHAGRTAPEPDRDWWCMSHEVGWFGKEAQCWHKDVSCQVVSRRAVLSNPAGSQTEQKGWSLDEL